VVLGLYAQVENNSVEKHQEFRRFGCKLDSFYLSRFTKYPSQVAAFRINCRLYWK